ncbi:MAG: hypothetical protein IJG64_03160, partial [Oscillospiraceae bacterium]|nr:hypothetical protein [Oscillospiraceae bacterium]
IILIFKSLLLNHIFIRNTTFRDKSFLFSLLSDRRSLSVNGTSARDLQALGVCLVGAAPGLSGVT